MRIDRQKIRQTIDGFVEGRKIDAVELYAVALLLDQVLCQHEREGAEMRALLEDVAKARGWMELEAMKDKAKAYLLAS